MHISFLEVIIAGIAGVALGVSIGYLAANKIHQETLADVLKRLGVTPEQLSKVITDMHREIKSLAPADDRIEITVEEHNGKVFAYLSENSRFVAQAESLEELLITLTDKFDSKFKIQNG